MPIEDVENIFLLTRKERQALFAADMEPVYQRVEKIRQELEFRHRLKITATCTGLLSLPLLAFAICLFAGAPLLLAWLGVAATAAAITLLTLGLILLIT